MVYCVDTVEPGGPMNDFKYLNIVDTLQQRIADGEYPDGKLPSTKSLREEFDASYGSVRSAILILKTLGVVEGKQGQGVFVIE
jgi:DNA-binding GntR family transcriptional regulator